ncbi:hypothetical protein [Streptomyces albospinus]|nr:hypothetical protein [Streptomyces albospinus]
MVKLFLARLLPGLYLDNPLPLTVLLALPPIAPLPRTGLLFLWRLSRALL